MKNIDVYASNLLVCMGISLFLFNDTIRPMISEVQINAKLNLLFIIIAIITICYMVLREQLDLRIIVLTMATTGFALIAIYSGSGKISHYVWIIATICLPLLITGIRLKYDDIEHVTKNFIRIFNILCLILITVGVFDYITGARVQLYLAGHNLFQDDLAALVYREQAWGIYRYYSFIGHPLTNGWYLLILYTVNIVYGRCFKPLMNEYLLIIITLIGLLLSGSRTALIIGLLMIFFLNNRKSKLPLLSSLLIFCIGLFSTSLFQKNLLQRFMISINSGDVTEGRNEALTWVLKGYVDPPSLFTGGGVSSSYHITANMDFIKSFEYPIIMLAYDIGMLSTMLFYLTLFIFPICVFLQHKSYRILLFFLLLSLYANGFNSLASYSDFTGQFCFLVMLLVNLSMCKKNKGELRADG